MKSRLWPPTAATSDALLAALASHVGEIERIGLDRTSAWRAGCLRRDRFALQVAYQIRLD
jgi:hypothetical protein